MSDSSILRLDRVSKDYGSTQALKAVSIEFDKGKIYGLVGENGAGKSTLVKIIGAVIQPSSGHLFLDGNEVKHSGPREARDAGIIEAPQEIELIPEMTVAENLFLGNWLGMKMFRKNKVLEASARVLERLGFSQLNARSRVGSLTTGEKQIVQIAKAFVHQPRILILDEPSAVLSTTEMEKVFGIIENLKREQVTVIYISHYIEEVLRIADEFVVLRDGELVTVLRKDEATRARLVSSMTGKTIGETLFERKARPRSEELALRVSGLSGENFRDLSLDLHRGEIIGIAGLVGSGKEAIGRTLFGLSGVRAGRVEFEGRSIASHGPRECIHEGIGLLPADRKSQGLVFSLLLSENISLPRLDRISVSKIINHPRETRLASELIEELTIRAPSPRSPVQSLSGGNQQKVVLAKWFFAEARVLILEEPTRGVDIGTKSDIYRHMQLFLEKGGAILLISSELEEVVTLSDYIIVLNRGRMAGRIANDSALSMRNRKEAVLQCML